MLFRSASMANQRRLQQVKQGNSAFMTVILRVHFQSNGWQKIMLRVAKSIDGVNSCRINEQGMVEVSGTMDPKLLLKALGKAGKGAAVHWLQFGQCSSNLFVPNPDPYSYHHSSYGGCGIGQYYNDNRFLQAPFGYYQDGPCGNQCCYSGGASYSNRQLMVPSESTHDIVCCSVM